MKMVPGEVSLALLYSGKHLLGHSDLIFHDHCKRKHLIGSKILILRSGPSFKMRLLCILFVFLFIVQQLLLRKKRTLVKPVFLVF